MIDSRRTQQRARTITTLCHERLATTYEYLYYTLAECCHTNGTLDETKLQTHKPAVACRSAVRGSGMPRPLHLGPFDSSDLHSSSAAVQCMDLECHDLCNSVHLTMEAKSIISSSSRTHARSLYKQTRRRCVAVVEDACECCRVSSRTAAKAARILQHHRSIKNSRHIPRNERCFSRTPGQDSCKDAEEKSAPCE